MILFFTWEERYLIDKKIEKWKKVFKQKYQSSNIYIFWEWNFNLDNIKQALLWWWLFDDKKFIIIKWAPKDSYTKINTSNLDSLNNFLQKNIENINKENVVVFISYKPDKRTKFYKFLSKNSDVKEHKLFNEKKLLEYIEKTFWVNNDLAKYILEKIGNNLFNIHNELEKILKINDKITKELIDKYVNISIEQDSFWLLDNLQNQKKFIEKLNNLQQNKEDFFKILWLLYWNLRNIILVLEQKQAWLSSKEIASKIGAHPFVVWKILKNYNNSSNFKKLFSNLIDIDYSIKNWKIDSSLWYLYLKKVFLEF